MKRAIEKYSKRKEVICTCKTFCSEKLTAAPASANMLRHLVKQASASEASDAPFDKVAVCIEDLIPPVTAPAATPLSLFVPINSKGGAT